MIFDFSSVKTRKDFKKHFIICNNDAQSLALQARSHQKAEMKHELRLTWWIWPTTRDIQMPKLPSLSDAPSNRRRPKASAYIGNCRRIVPIHQSLAVRLRTADTDVKFPMVPTAVVEARVRTLKSQRPTTLWFRVDWPLGITRNELLMYQMRRRLVSKGKIPALGKLEKDLVAW